MKPEVSVVLPYYEGDFSALERAVESVLSQEGVASELLVVNDGSSRSPASIFESRGSGRVRLIEKEHGGIGAALNRGAREARSEYLCFLDQDDVMLPGRLRKQLRAFAGNPRSGAIYSDYERVTAEGLPIDRMIAYQASRRQLLHRLAKAESLIAMQNLMIRRTVFHEAGGFPEVTALSGHDDTIFLARLLLSGAALVYEPGVVHRWVRHENNFSETRQSMEARLVMLDHLSALAGQYPEIEAQMPFFVAHAHARRGLYFLENRMGRAAAREFSKALRATPSNLSLYYMAAKSLLRGGINGSGTKGRNV